MKKRKIRLAACLLAGSMIIGMGGISRIGGRNGGSDERAVHCFE